MAYSFLAFSGDSSQYTFTKTVLENDLLVKCTSLQIWVHFESTVIPLLPAMNFCHFVGQCKPRWDMDEGWMMCNAITLSTLDFLSTSLSSMFCWFTTFEAYIVFRDEFSFFYRFGSKGSAVIQRVFCTMKRELLVWFFLNFLQANSFLSHHLKVICLWVRRRVGWWLESIVLEAWVIPHSANLSHKLYEHWKGRECHILFLLIVYSMVFPLLLDRVRQFF